MNHLSLADLFLVGLVLDVSGAILLARGLLLSPRELSRLSTYWGVGYGQHEDRIRNRVAGELKATLRLARDEAVVVERDETKQREIFEFPEAVLTRYVFAGEDGKPDLKLLRERATLSEEVLRHFAALWLIVWPAHLRRKGVDRSRLYRITGGAGDQDT